jgi:hypothetical protein
MDVHGIIILKWILAKYGVKSETKTELAQDRTQWRALWARLWNFEFYKGKEFRDQLSDYQMSIKHIMKLVDVADCSFQAKTVITVILGEWLTISKVLWDFRFSRRRIWSLKSSGMQSRWSWPTFQRCVLPPSQKTLYFSNVSCWQQDYTDLKISSKHQQTTL